jgi:hypothetical protein
MSKSERNIPAGFATANPSSGGSGDPAYNAA